MNQLQYIVRDRPNFSRLKEVLNAGLSMSRGLGIENATLFFMQAYTSKYQDRRSYDLRLEATYLYENKGSFRDSYFNFEKIKASSFATPSIKVAMDLKTLKLLKRYGSESDMFKISSRLIQSSKNLRVLAGAYEIQIKLAKKVKNTAELSRIEKAIDSIGLAHPDIRETKALARLSLLENKDLSPLYRPVQSISLKDPTAHVKKVFAQFTQVYRDYMEVCSLSNSGCVVAMTTLMGIAEKTRDTLAEVTINSSIDQKVQQSFLSYQKYVVSSLDRMSASASKAASSVAFNQGGLPESVQEMLWFNGKDWNFNPLSWGEGSGFIHWQM
ncbi:MAG: hypothetical protein OXC40_07440 [Proteobacteria bacterium]|nr:hypothetical protein [Pseudomonadota bacterium]